jgi:hypothetical protein
MTENWIVFVLAFGIVLGCDARRLKTKGARERRVYVGIMLFAAYLGVLFAMKWRGPNMSDLELILFRKPAEWIARSFKMMP